jgi:hypothetical protein
MNEYSDFTDFSIGLMNIISQEYLLKIRENIEKNPQLLNNFPAFLIKPEKIVFYYSKTHLAIEYIGSERISELPIGVDELEFEIFDYTLSDDLFFENIIGFKYDCTRNGFSLPLPPINENLIFPTNRGFDKLFELGWNFFAQDMIFGMNTPAPTFLEGNFHRIVNGFFFDSDGGFLKTRHIKWMDVIPIIYDDSNLETDSLSINLSFYSNLIEHDTNYKYPIPDEFRLEKLPKINRFIELINSQNIGETVITNFLAKNENKFILTMHFGAKDIYDELICEWQSEERNNIKPDFFVLQTDGYANIVEFKLPIIKSKVIVGKNNRETFSSEINSYISQTRVYETYFDDPNNRKWFENKYGFKVHKPKRILIVGKRTDFKSEEWREIKADFRNIEILTFDDLIDGTVAQFYR